MGNGAAFRYCYKTTTADDTGKDNDNWRMPKQKKKPGGSAAKAPPPDEKTWRKPKGDQETKPASVATSISNNQSVAKAQAHTAEKIATTWHVPEPRTILEMGKSPPPVTKDEDDDDFSGFENLLGAADKVWEDLMAQKHETKRDFATLFQLGELKEGVERAAKRVEHLQRELNMANAKVDAKKAELDQLCAKIKSNTSNDSSVAWKLGDVAIRRGKGLCEISMVHNEVQPPYFEVRMASTADVVGTEASKLIPLMPADSSIARKVMHELDDARRYALKLEGETSQAQEEVKELHIGLTGQMDEVLKQSQAQAPELPGSFKSEPQNMQLPPGMPGWDVLRKSSATPRDHASSFSSPARRHSTTYPDMKGTKEDVRGSIQPQVSARSENSQSPPVHKNVQNISSQPSGFPNLDELNKMSQQAQDVPQVGIDYPSVHPGAVRETFHRPSGQPERLDKDEPATQNNKSFGVAFESQGPSVPNGFPAFEKNDCSGKQTFSSEPPPFRAGGLGAHAEKSRAEAQAAHAAAAEARARAQAQAQAETEAEARAKAKEEQKKQSSQQKEQAAVPEWVCYQTAEGVPYYHNERTGETVWQLPSGASARYPNGQTATPTRGKSFNTNDWFKAEQAADDDPFMDLRKQEEAMRQQREYWSQWYSQYSTWYQQQAQQQANQQTSGGASNTDLPRFGTQGGSASQSGKQLPPKGPSPPKLDASIEDRAIFAIKSAVLKEMEQMVDQGTSVAQRKKALRCLQVRWHPDKNPEKVEVANSVFQFIEETKPWFLHDQEGQDAT